MSDVGIRRRPAGVPEDLPADLHPVVRRVLAARGVRCAADIPLELADMLPVGRLSGLEPAIELLLRHRAAGSRLLVVGDFDTDGATSTALMMLVLRRFGFDVDYLVPDRFEYGYGLTPEIVALAAGRQADLIVTVDNGISSAAGVRAAASAGIDVLITDHHLPGAELPAAAAIVNPNVAGAGGPGGHLAGVGVAFYLLAALARTLQLRSQLPAGARGSADVADCLDLVALGTVADLVPLDRTNRVLVWQGLRRIRAGRCRPGISALLAEGGRERGRATSLDLAYAVAPRLNAAGRLTDMRRGIECLLAEDAAAAMPLAAELNRLNVERRELERRMRAEAMQLADELLSPGLEAATPTALCLFDERWHQGIVGLVASRVREQVHRPVVAFARAADGVLKGSARSVPALHIRDTLDAIATRRPGLLDKFGGHAMAAGLSLEADRLDEFRTAFETEVRSRISPDDLQGWLHSDGPLAGDELSLATALALREAGPWGQGFPEPLFDGEFELSDCRIVGDRHCRMRVRSSDGGPACDAILFERGERLVDAAPGRARLAYRLDIDEYRGVPRLQLIIEHFEPL